MTDLRRLRPTTVWVAGEPVTVEGPLVDPGGRADPDDWARYQRELADAEAAQREAAT